MILKMRIQGWEDTFYQHVQFNKFFFGCEYNIGLSKCPKILLFNWSKETRDSHCQSLEKIIIDNNELFTIFNKT